MLQTSEFRVESQIQRGPHTVQMDGSNLLDPIRPNPIQQFLNCRNLTQPDPKRQYIMLSVRKQEIPMQFGKSRVATLTAENNYATKSPHLPPKLPLPFRRSPPPSNTPISRPTPLTTPNGIQIQSAILPQYTFRTDRPTDQPTDGLGDRSVPRPAYALYTVFHKKQPL